MDIKTINRYLAGESTDKEREKLEHWLDENSLNREKFNFLKKIWDTEIESPINFDSEKNFRKIQELLTQGENNNLRPITSKTESYQLTNISEIDKDGGIKQSGKGRIHISLIYKVAAVLLAGMIGIGVIFYHLEQQAGLTDEFVHNKLPEVQTFETQRGELSTIDVKDGIQVKMNTSSSIRVFSDEEKDQVILEGEAYFDIQRNDQKKFIVQSNSVTISVIGTKFNVKNRVDLQTTEVVVQEGRVMVDLIDKYSNKVSVILNKGEQLVYNENDNKFWAHDQVDIDDLLFWMDGGLYFENTPFSEVLLRLEDRYAVDFIVSDSALLRKPLSARFKHEGLAEILHITALTLGFEYEKIEEDLFEIYDSSNPENLND